MRETAAEEYVVLEIEPRLAPDTDLVECVLGPTTDRGEATRLASVDPALDERTGLRYVPHGASAPRYRVAARVVYRGPELAYAHEELEQLLRERGYDPWDQQLAEDEPEQWAHELEVAGRAAGLYVVALTEDGWGPWQWVIAELAEVSDE